MRLLPHTHAIRICKDTRQLRTTRGTLRYDQLVLAHGAQAALPPALPAALCWRINHLGAYLQLRAALGDAATTGPKDVLIVGAGLIGSELANDLALGGHRITLLDVQPEPLARWHADQAGAQVLQAWKDLPIRFVGEVKVASVERLALDAERLWKPLPEGMARAGLSTRLRITTECGQHFAADEVIVAAGLQTPSRLAQSAGLAWADGICGRPAHPANQRRSHPRDGRLHHARRPGQPLHRADRPPGQDHCRGHHRLRACALRNEDGGGACQDDVNAADLALNRKIPA